MSNQRPADQTAQQPDGPDRRQRTTDIGETLVEVRDLKTYYDDGGLLRSNPVQAVDGVNLDIARGETLGLVGESGCGKTTLGRTLIQLEHATDGEIRFDGTDVTSLSGSDLKAWRRNSQMVFQDPESSLNSRMTVGEIIREPLDVHDWKTPRERRERVRELLDVVGLQAEHYYRYPHQFSGGQGQRIGIARALALSPEFVVLDEPVSALDVSVQAQILNLLDDLQEEFGLTYLFIAHDLSVVRHICDRVAVMYLGNVVERAETESLFTDPQHPYTHALLSAIPEPDPTADRNRITLRGTPPSPRDPPEGCPFTTRCPMKIRPGGFRDLDADAWVAIETFRGVVRARLRADRSFTDIARGLLGRDTRFADVEEVRAEVFGDVLLPPEASEAVDTAVSRLENGDVGGAQEHLDSTFGSVCDAETPANHEVGDGADAETGHLSHCHRHEDEYVSPTEFTPYPERRASGEGGGR